MVDIVYLKAYANALHISYRAAEISLLLILARSFVSAFVAILVSVPVILAVRRSQKN
ncbi:hypothetical protein [Caldanaerobius polysaccharolyticus]|uniref:hypothetical protein n=1 Tax=Caldanaerobius polysaccharolyticus TaxID=44256 RepID=UPI001C54F576|nr:hypothetical protein [Caldanaerobius polysaccharolyticus]